jgi:tight adherence protein B
MTFWYASAAALAVAGGVVAIGRGLRRQAARHETLLVDRTARDLASLFLFVDPSVLVRVSAAAFVAVLLLALVLTQSVVVAIALAGATWAVPSFVVRWLRRKRLDQLLHQLPDALDAWAMSLRSGLSVSQAIAQLASQQPAPLGQELTMMSREQRVGVPLDSALQGLAARVPLSEFALLATTVRVARESGGSLAEALDRLSANLRRKLAMHDKIRALTAQGRIQGVVVAALPLLVMAALFWLQPDAMQPLVTTPAGWGTLGAVVGLEVLGYWLIRRIVNIEV